MCTPLAVLENTYIGKLGIITLRPNHDTVSVKMHFNYLYYFIFQHAFSTTEFPNIEKMSF